MRDRLGSYDRVLESNLLEADKEDRYGLRYVSRGRYAGGVLLL
jgi:hypothetical protein